jgi:hypothetical protein
MFRSKLATTHDLIIVNINVCTDFELLNIKVTYPSNFSARWVSYYVGRDVTDQCHL